MKRDRIKIKKKSHKRLKNMVMVVILMAIIVGGYWYFLNELSKDTKSADSLGSLVSNKSNQNDLEKIKIDTVIRLKILRRDGKFGQWPITSVSLSSNRGNPFIKK